MALLKKAVVLTVMISSLVVVACTQGNQETLPQSNLPPVVGAPVQAALSVEAAISETLASLYALDADIMISEIEGRIMTAGDFETIYNGEAANPLMTSFDRDESEEVVVVSFLTTYPMYQTHWVPGFSDELTQERTQQLMQPVDESGEALGQGYFHARDSGLTNGYVLYDRDSGLVRKRGLRGEFLEANYGSIHDGVKAFDEP